MGCGCAWGFTTAGSAGPGFFFFSSTGEAGMDFLPGFGATKLLLLAMAGSEKGVGALGAVTGDGILCVMDGFMISGGD